MTIYSAHMDMGQGIYHGTATLNEELMADWSRIFCVEGGSGNPVYYGNITWGGTVQGTGGSSGILSSFDRYRMAGATARVMLVNAAAAEWGCAGLRGQIFQWRPEPWQPTGGLRRVCRKGGEQRSAD